MLTKGQKAKLQRLINKTAATASASYKANAALMEWCLDTYGYEPGDIDADYIIDSLGGGGESEAISADLFDSLMQKRG